MKDPIDSEEAARNLARSVASDICLYKKEKVKEAPSSTEARQAIKPEIEEGRTLYAGKVSPRLLGLFDDELDVAIERTRTPAAETSGGRPLAWIALVLIAAGLIAFAIKYLH